jgi:hypothetical protein
MGKSYESLSEPNLPVKKEKPSSKYKGSGRLTLSKFLGTFKPNRQTGAPSDWPGIVRGDLSEFLFD